jgi:hypothetical protein
MLFRGRRQHGAGFQFIRAGAWRFNGRERHAQKRGCGNSCGNSGPSDEQSEHLPRLRDALGSGAVDITGVSPISRSQGVRSAFGS